MPENIRIVAYARVSSKEQADKELSIPAQLKAIRKYCQDKGWKLVSEYLDEGKSAKTADRPAFQKMIALAKKQNRHFDAIVVHKFDRFSRSREDHVIFKSLLKKHGVLVYSATEQIEPDTPHGFLLEGMLEVISEFYNMNLANETRKGMVENAKRGYHNGGVPPYGFRVGKIKDGRGNDKSVWVLGPDEEVNTVRRIFDLYVRQNKGYKAITRLLNEEGIPSPKGGLWSWTTVWHILHNEAYIGQKIWNKYDYVNHGKKKKPQEEWIIRADSHPSIVDRDTFKAVITKSHERAPEGSATKSKGPSLYILRGLLKCPMCGANMVTGSNGKNTRGHTRYYHCGTYHRKGSKACKRNGVPKEKIEIAVINSLIREFSMLSYPGSLEEEIKRYSDYQNREAKFKLARLTDDIDYLTRRIEITNREDIKPNKLMAEYLDDLESELQKLQKEKKEAEKQVINPDLNLDQLKTIRDALNSFVSSIKVAPPEQQHNILKEYITNIIVDHFNHSTQLEYRINPITNSDPDINIPLFKKRLHFGLA